VIARPLPVVTVLVVCYNQRRFLDDCFKAVLDQSFPAEAVEILVLDNHSSDGSPQHVKEKYPGLHLCVFESNLGYYGALNEGVSKANGQYVIILPADTIVHKAFMTELVDVADSDPGIAVCMANTVNPNAPDYPAKERVEMPKHMYIPRDTIFGNPRIEQTSLTPEPSRVLLGSGVSFLIRRRCFTHAGELFDPCFPHYATDIDVSLRANALGWSTVFVPKAVVYHIDNTKATVGFDLLWRYFIGSRDRLLAFFKSMTSLEYILAMPMLLIGIPHKVLVMRSTVRWWMRLLLFCAATLLSPLVFAAALVKMPHFLKKRQDVLDNRQVGSLWLLRHLANRSALSNTWQEPNHNRQLHLPRAPSFDRQERSSD
jgi:GT2 family glycosyltransferase